MVATNNYLDLICRQVVLRILFRRNLYISTWEIMPNPTQIWL